jgi:ankyrin repeat protein
MLSSGANSTARDDDTSLDVAEFLIQQGADISSLNRKGETLLHRAGL